MLIRVGKHFAKKEKNKNNKIMLLCIILLISFVFCGVLLINYDVNNGFIYKQITDSNNSIINMTKNENKTVSEDTDVLKIKSNSDYDKVIEFIFNNNKLSNMVIEEKFETDEIYKKKKEIYNVSSEFNIIEVDDANRYIKYEKLNLETDENLTYDEIYNKYLVRFLDIYTKIL